MKRQRCVVCNSKKLRFMKEQETTWLLSELNIKMYLKNTIIG